MIIGVRFDSTDPKQLELYRRLMRDLQEQGYVARKAEHIEEELARKESEK